MRRARRGVTALTMFEKVWRAHEVVPETADTPAVLYVDLHLVHEVTSPQAFAVLRERGIPVRRPERTLSTLDHSTPTEIRSRSSAACRSGSKRRRSRSRALERNAAEFGIELLGLSDSRRGIVHVIGPELGATQPGMTIVCGDSHTSTHGAFGDACLRHRHAPKSGTCLRRNACCNGSRRRSRSRSTAGFAPGVSAKDLVLAIIGRIGVSGGAGHVIEYRGRSVRALSMEERMTVCNMSIEAGARAGHDCAGRDDLRIPAESPARANSDADWESALERWRQLSDDAGADIDRTVTLDASRTSSR